PIKKRDIVVITKESSFSENKISEMWCGATIFNRVDINNLFWKMTSTTISDFMRKRIETIGELETVQGTARKMKDKNVSSLLVVDKDGKPVGLITERDLVRKACVSDVRLSAMTNRQLMSSPLITIDSKESPSIAADLMLQNNVRHLLVVDTNAVDRPVGIVTPLDFTRFQELKNEEINKDDIEKILEYYRT
ncbi:MAG: CBS domain-containing protein, partial [Nitrososphaeraceae archaeon]